MVRRGKFGHTGRMPCDYEGRDWSDMVMSQGMPKNVGNHQKLGRGKEEFFSRAFRESVALPAASFWTFSLWNHERIIFCCF